RAEGAQGWEGIEDLGGEDRTNYPVTLSIDDRGDGFALTAQVQAPIDPAHVCGLMERALAELVAALEGAPETPSWQVDVLPAEERQRVLVAWNATEAVYPRQRCVHELFEARAAAQP